MIPTMKKQNLFRMLLVLLCAIAFVSCSDEKDVEEVKHLTFEKSYYEFPIRYTRSITILDGNKDYTIEVSNPDILDATVDLSIPIGMGDLKISPKQKGETIVSVHDNVANETVDLEIKITDTYLNLLLGNLDQIPYSAGDQLFLIDNDNKDFYLYDEYLQLKNKGSFEFSVAENTPYMTLTFQDEFEGRKVYKYDISKSHQATYEYTRILLGIEWDVLTKGSRAINDVAPIFMRAKDTQTEMEYDFILRTNSMPEHVLE